MVNCYKYSITPVSKPRQTRSDVWKKRPCVVKYRKFADKCRELNIEIRPFDHVIFHIPMPKSWSNKKKLKMDSKPHLNRPDIDNLGKAIMDAVLKEDSHIHDIRLSKIWSFEGYIEIIRTD